MEVKVNNIVVPTRCVGIFVGARVGLLDEGFGVVGGGVAAVGGSVAGAVQVPTNVQVKCALSVPGALTSSLQLLPVHL